MRFNGRSGVGHVWERRGLAASEAVGKRWSSYSRLAERIRATQKQGHQTS